MISELTIKEEFIRLDQALKLAGFVMTGGMAKMMIIDGLVTVNGEVCTQRGRKLRLGDKAELEGNTLVIKNVGK